MLNRFKKDWWQYTKAVLGLLFVIYALFQVTNEGDFRVFLDAARLLREGKSPYHIWLLRHNCLYLYSPFFALLLEPFTYMSPVVANLLWIIASLFFTFRSFMLMRNYLPAHFPRKWQNELLLIIPALCVLRFWLYNIQLLQMTLFILWCILESLRAFEKNRYLFSGALLALGINIKILPVVLLPYLFLRKQWKAFPPVFVFSFLLLVLPALFLGYNFNLHLLAQWWNEINPSMGKQYAFENDLGPQSLNALIPSLLMKTNGDYPLARNLLDLQPATVMLVLNGVRLAFLVSVLYFTGVRPRKSKTRLHTAREISYIILLIPLVFPHQQKYAFVLAFPAITYLTWYLIEVYNRNYIPAGRWRWRTVIVLLVLSFVLMTLTTDGIVGRTLCRISEHFRLITYGTILLCAAMFLCDNRHIEPAGEANAA